MHYYVAKEYVSQLMKKKYSCKKAKNEDAAIKMKQQWNELKKLFVEMVRYSPVSNNVKYTTVFFKTDALKIFFCIQGSSLNWLYPLGNYLSDIIGMEIEKNIKDLLNPLVSNYPDIR